VLIATFNYYPLFSALYHSLFTWDGFTTPKYVGLQNFANLWSDPAIQASIKNMGILALSAVLITLTMPLLVAELVLSVRHAGLFKVYRALLVVPIVVPQLVTLLLWSFMYDPSQGVINSLLSAIGLGSIAPQWLGDPAVAIYAIIGIGFPWVAGLNFLLYLAALQNIPAEIHDAGRLDGAVGWRRIIMLDLPLITVQIRLLVTLALITVMQTFTSVWVLTQGGPGYATTVPGVVLYQQAFQFSNFGYASAIGAMIFVVTLALTILSNGIGRLLSHEQGA
jgi:raffinose/stachyose/melibiose transport system permease protein